MNQDPSIQKEIGKLKITLQDYEDTDPGYMGPDMKELRHFVLFTHMRLEESLGLLIIKDNLKSFLPKYPPFTPDQQSAFTLGTASMIEIDYYRKVEIASGRKLIDGTTQQSMNNINRLRNWFPHPSKFQEKLDMLKSNETEYKKALEQLVDAHVNINRVFLPFLSPRTK